MVDSILSTGLSGVLNGSRLAADSAVRVTRAFEPDATEDPIVPIVDLTAAEVQVKASAKVIKVGDDMLKSILDLLA